MPLSGRFRVVRLFGAEGLHQIDGFVKQGGFDVVTSGLVHSFYGAMESKKRLLGSNFLANDPLGHPERYKF